MPPPTHRLMSSYIVEEAKMHVASVVQAHAWNICGTPGELPPHARGQTDKRLLGARFSLGPFNIYGAFVDGVDCRNLVLLPPQDFRMRLRLATLGQVE